MAIAQQQSETAEQRPWSDYADNKASRGERVEAWFEAVIWHSREVCSHCFTPLRRLATIERDHWGNAVEVSTLTEGAVRGFDEVALDAHGAITKHPERTTCGECGSVGGLAMSDPLSEREAVDRVPALIERLESLGHVVDAGDVYDAVRELKTDPERQANDKRIFATAAALGVIHG